MKRRGSVPLHEARELAAGRRVAPRTCRECGARAARTWCSDVCVEAFRIRAWPGHARRRVLERDRGVCGLCGLDVLALEARLAPLAHTPFYLVRLALRGDPGARAELERDPVKAGAFAALVQVPWAHARWFAARSLWEADHRVPLAEGGANELVNLRTLCGACHDAATRALAARRAARRAKPQEAPA